MGTQQQESRGEMSRALRQMLGDKDAPSTQALLSLIESAPKPVVCAWCLDTAESRFLPIFARRCPDDGRPRMALDAARRYLAKDATHAQVRNVIWYMGPHASDTDVVARAARKAVGQAASVVRYPSKWHALGVFLYGSAAVAYDLIGVDASGSEYDVIAEDVCREMSETLRTRMSSS